MNRSWLLSIGLHGVIIAFCLAVVVLQQQPVEEELSFQVLEKITKVEPKDFQQKPKTPPPPPEAKKPAPPARKKVYGLNQKSITTDSPSGAQVKAGNTLAKTPDDLKLDKDNEDSIPIPTDEFLVTSMPRVLEEVRPTYPESARQQGLEGTVVLEIIVDQDGRVRQVKVVQSMGEEMDQAAIEAMQKFRFRPAQVEEQKVAVKINYGIKFILEI